MTTTPRDIIIKDTHRGLKYVDGVLGVLEIGGDNRAFGAELLRELLEQLPSPRDQR